MYTDDVVIHGIRVRATTNSAHLHDFWIDDWYDLDEWRKATGQAPASQPQVTVYALQGHGQREEAAYYSHTRNTNLFFNTSYYGQLKSWARWGASWRRNTAPTPSTVRAFKKTTRQCSTSRPRGRASRRVHMG